MALTELEAALRGLWRWQFQAIPVLWAYPVSETPVQSHGGGFWFTCATWAINPTSGNLSWGGNPERKKVRVRERVVPFILVHSSKNFSVCLKEKYVATQNNGW